MKHGVPPPGSPALGRKRRVTDSHVVVVVQIVVQLFDIDVGLFESAVRVSDGDGPDVMDSR